MTVFFSDLDNTLVYSHRRDLPGEKVCVEMLDGREQSYMTESSFSFLTGNHGITIVPVTARTEAQYRRLTCMDAMRVRYALICGGGRLLVDGAADPEWTRETLRLTEAERQALPPAAELLRRIASGALVEPEPFMVYARCEDPRDACGRLRAAVDPELLAAACDRRKVYLFCRSVNKGAAVRRFLQRFPADFTVAAGDDPLDIPMLNEAGLALAPVPLGREIRHGRVSLLSGSCISDEICARLKTLVSAEMAHDGKEADP